MLLLALPLLFTQQKLLVLPELGERSHQLFAETVTITGLDPMKNSCREVFIPLVVSFPNLGDKLCFVRDVLSKFLHGVVNPRTLFRVLENSVIEQSQLRAEILKGDVGVNQVISPHLRFMLIVRIDVVRRSYFLVNRGSQLKDTICQQRCVSFRSLGADGESVKL